MSVVDATINSVNVVYAQLMMEVGAENVDNLCEEMEIYDIGSNPAIGLGGLETGITPLDVSKIFSTLASGGFYYQPVCILKIEDAEGNILYEYDPDKNEANKRILENPEAYYITGILKKVIESGTGRGAGIGRPAAGKTGTTSDFKKPDKELIDIKICTVSNLLATLWCPEETSEWKIFVEGKEPKDICDIHNKVEVPDVVGLKVEEAKALFEDLNFVVEEINDFDDTYNQGIVFKQNPEAGTILESLEGEKLSITLYVSKGLKTFIMPDMEGMELNKATKLIEDLELVIDSIIYDFSDTQPLDKITKHYPPLDSMVSKSTGGTLYVRKGETPESLIPDVAGLTEKEDPSA